MKKYATIFALMLVCCMFTACTVSKSTVSQNVDITKYEYASIINNDTYRIPAELMEYEIQLFDAIEASHLQMVSERRLFELSPEQQQKLLLVKVAVYQDDTEAIVTANFMDYMTGRPVASCRGAYGLGLDYSDDLKGAIKRVAEQITTTFQR